MKRIIIILVVISAILSLIVVRNMRRDEQQYHENAEYVSNDDEYKTLRDELPHLEEGQEAGSDLKKQNGNKKGNYYVRKSYIPYKIDFACPNNWKVESDITDAGQSEIIFSGRDGFLRISLIEGKEMELETIALGKLYQREQPYGKNPVIQTGRMNGLRGIFVIPSIDQDKKFNMQAFCIIEYQKPLLIDDKEFKYICLTSLKSKIGVIAKSLRVTE